MKVLQFVPSLNVYDGGTATYMQHLAPALGGLCELHICALTPIEDFVPISGCHLHRIPLSLSHIREMKTSWLQLLRDIQPDVVHVNGCWMLQTALVIRWTERYRTASISLREAKSRPVIVLTPHGMLEPWIVHRHYLTRKLPALLLYQRRALQRCDLLVATSESERSHLQDYVPSNRIRVVSNGINVRDIVVKTEYQAPRRLLFMSRIHPKKGLEMLFSAMNKVPASLSLIIAGDGEPGYVATLRRQVDDLHLGDRVSFAGAVYGEEKWKLIRQADVVVLPSYSENYGLIVAESLASGVPVLTTTGTPWQSVAKCSCGWWVAPTVSAITQALQNVVTQTPDTLRQMGINARKLAETDCAVDVQAGLLMQIYQSEMT